LSTFQDFSLAAPILKALAAEGYVTPTPIQSQAIPPVMEGRDVLGIAQTGTGKTAAFALPILHRLSQNPKHPVPKTARSLILAPTRELASQIAESVKAYGKQLRIHTAVVYGGVSLSAQERAVARGVDVLVATPGRLLDLVERRSLVLSAVEILVLDEADQMLDLGFIHALKRIAKLVPARRQTLFFSATMPTSIAELAGSFLHQPVKVAVTPVATTVEKVEQGVIFVQTAQKQALLETLARDPALERAIVFTRTKHGADKVVKKLEAVGIEAAAIHGNKSQGQRERALAGFKNGTVRLLVATDIAARGIDVDGVSHVINFDLPNVPESYVHRIGRTARAGKTGIAVAFCAPDERAFLRDIEKLTKRTVPVMAPPEGFAAIADRREAPDAPRVRQPQQGRPQNKPQQGRPHGQGGPKGGQQGRPGGQGAGQGRGPVKTAVDAWPRAEDTGIKPSRRRRRPGRNGAGGAGGGGEGAGLAIGWIKNRNG
jgi:ATP-dependent RNA helicase RhlE